MAKPSITGLTPAEGPTSGGTPVSITGADLGGASEVAFGPTPATDVFINPAGTQLKATTPARSSSGTVPVKVKTLEGTSNAYDFTYRLPAPTIISLSPAQGPAGGGTFVTITGTGLSGANEVAFGPTPATDVFINPTGTQLKATAPPSTSAGPVLVTVTTPEGTSNPRDFTYTEKDIEKE